MTTARGVEFVASGHFNAPQEQIDYVTTILGERFNHLGGKVTPNIQK